MRIWFLYQIGLKHLQFVPKGPTPEQGQRPRQRERIGLVLAQSHLSAFPSTTLVVRGAARSGHLLLREQRLKKVATKSSQEGEGRDMWLAKEDWKDIQMAGKAMGRGKRYTSSHRETSTG